MSTRSDEHRDDLLSQAAEEGPDVLETWARLTGALRPVPPSAAARARLMGAIEPAGRFERFVDALADLIDVGAERARELLDGVWPNPGWEDGPFPGTTRQLWIDGGPRVAAAITGFVTVTAGETFHEHEHLGAETVLVLQGTMETSDGDVVRPGETLTMPAGSSHSFRALGGGPDLLYFAVVFEGVRVGDAVIRPR